MISSLTGLRRTARAVLAHAPAGSAPVKCVILHYPSQSGSIVFPSRFQKWPLGPSTAAMGPSSLGKRVGCMPGGRGTAL
ncbi:uncharacterized protein N7482_008520 [Penicillium canariense]|uniref:Uncharacterized protein n=1 Tax=Penicillium canariense TaxID=189055 RepID=A0A9W9LJ27_9EURO|nr:uncharacterized protein N7482_008520 [Penicillium canariense]KAJ5157420.1 hypothetical protein N7482_008520 [Penicillium canariense]